MQSFLTNCDLGAPLNCARVFSLRCLCLSWRTCELLNSYSWLARNEGVDPYSSPYITQYRSCHFLFPFFLNHNPVKPNYGSFHFLFHAVFPANQKEEFWQGRSAASWNREPQGSWRMSYKGCYIEDYIGFKVYGVVTAQDARWCGTPRPLASVRSSQPTP